MREVEQIKDGIILNWEKQNLVKNYYRKVFY